MKIKKGFQTASGGDFVVADSPVNIDETLLKRDTEKFGSNEEDVHIGDESAEAHISAEGKVRVDGSVPEEKNTAIRPRAVSDAPIVSFADDKLEFGAYAKALGNLIDNPETETPFVLAINAPWGSGKSSLGHMIEEHLQSKPSAGGTYPHVTFWFDAWMHDEAGNLTTAFISELSRTLDKRRNLIIRLLRPMPAAFMSPSQRLWSRIGKAFLFIIIATFLYWILPDSFRKAISEIFNALNESKPVDAAKVSSAVAAVGGPSFLSLLLLWFRDLFGIGKKIGEFVNDPGGTAGRGSLGEVRQQLANLIHGTIPQGSRLVIFIDDLERCRGSSGIDLLEAVNQLLGGNGVVTVIMTDIHSLSSIANIKYEALAKRHLNASGKLDPDGMGYHYLQKIIQMIFTLPEHRASAIERMVDDLTREEAPHENGGNAIRLEPLSAAWDADASLSKYVNMWNTYIDGLNIFLSPIVHIIKFILMPCFIISKNAYDITITNSIRQFIRPVKSNIYIILFSSLTVMLLSVGFYKHSTIASVSNTISVYIINYIVSAIPKSFILAFILQNGEITTGASIVFFSFLFLIMFILSLWLVYFIIAIYIRLEIPRRHKEYITLINNLRLYNGDGATQTKDYRVTNEYVNVDLAAYTISAEKKYQLMANDSAIFKEARSEIIQRGRFGPRKIKRAVNRLRVLISMLSE